MDNDDRQLSGFYLAYFSGVILLIYLWTGCASTIVLGLCVVPILGFGLPPFMNFVSKTFVSLIYGFGSEELSYENGSYEDDMDKAKRLIREGKWIGAIHGSDKYLWYDFYEILGHSLKQTNSRHPEFYKKMIPLYQHRIQELEAEIQSIMEEKSKDVSEASVLELFTQLKRDHMKRYREFIRKASGIIRRSK